MKKYSKEQLERELENFLSLGAKHIIKQKYSEIFFSRPMSLKKLKEFIGSKLSLKVSEKELKAWKEEYETNLSNNQNQNIDNQNSNTQKQQILINDDSTNQEEVESWR